MDIKARENRARKAAAERGLTLSKARGKGTGIFGPYTLTPVPTREAQERYRGRYTFKTFWLDDLETELGIEPGR